jgi:hypothetical protein
MFVAFDLAIQLASSKRRRGLGRKGVGEGPHIDEPVIRYAQHVCERELSDHLFG